MLTDADLMALQIETLFRLDSRGRLLALNDPRDGEAPRLFVGLTRVESFCRFPDDVRPRFAVMTVDTDNAGSLLVGFPDLRPDLPSRLPCFAIVREGKAVSVCFSARRSSHAAEAGVETLAGYRGHGYATAAVAAHLGLRIYGADLEFL